jgi:hypothetical protein
MALFYWQIGNLIPFRVVVTNEFFFFSFDSYNQPPEQKIKHIPHVHTYCEKRIKTIKTHPRRVGSGLKRMRIDFQRRQAQLYTSDKYCCCSFLRRKVIIEKFGMYCPGTTLIRHATLLFISISILSMKSGILIFVWELTEYWKIKISKLNSTTILLPCQMNISINFPWLTTILSICSVYHNNAEIGMYVYMRISTFDHLRISNARKHDNSVWSIHTKNVNDDDDDELSMSFVICFEKRQLVLECIVSTSGLNI